MNPSLVRLLIAGAASVGLILLLTFVVARLIRSRNQGFSVRMQIFLALAGIVGAFAFGLGILVIDRIESRAERLALAAAHEESHTIAALLQSEMKRTDVSFDVLAEQLKQRTPDPNLPAFDIDRMGLELLDEKGSLLYPERGSSQAQERGAVFVDATVTRNGTEAGIVRVVKPTIIIQSMLADFAPTVLVISLVLGAAAAGAAAWIGRTIADPIEALSLYSQKVSQGERAQLPAELPGREVKRLVEAIDRMRERLEGRPFVETFAADLSHELKNPVAAVRASAEVLEEGALDEPEQARKFVARIREAAERIEKLLAELLGLAHVETRGPAHLAEVSLSEIIEKVLATLGPERERIEFKATTAGRTKGDSTWLARAVTNLVDNALTHSPSDSLVHLNLSEEDGEISLCTQNDGALDEHLQKSLFRRFVTTRRDKGGTGLGLSIVHAVAEAHGGHAELMKPGPPRVKFQMRLPGL